MYHNPVKGYPSEVYIADSVLIYSSSYCGIMETASWINCTKIAGGFNPSHTAQNKRINWVSDSQGLILGRFVSSNPETGENRILNIFFPNDQIMMVSNTSTINSTKINRPSNNDLKI